MANLPSVYYEYEAIATNYSGFSLENDIKQMSVRQRSFWNRMARHRMEEKGG